MFQSIEWISIIVTDWFKFWYNITNIIHHIQLEIISDNMHREWEEDIDNIFGLAPRPKINIAVGVPVAKVIYTEYWLKKAHRVVTTGPIYEPIDIINTIANLTYIHIALIEDTSYYNLNNMQHVIGTNIT